MTKSGKSERFDEIEQTQANLRQNIEASKKLIERSDDLLENYRRLASRTPQPPPPQEAGC
ncbi:MAG TPA: hypothetical protein VF589_05340 [Allosphingosinicella sp.]